MIDLTVNEIKAEAVKDFVNMIVGAYESGFTDTPIASIAQIHRAAQIYCSDNYGAEIQSISDTWGEAVAEACADNAATRITLQPVECIYDIELVGQDILVWDGCQFHIDHVELSDACVPFMANGTDPEMWAELPAHEALST